MSAVLRTRMLPTTIGTTISTDASCPQVIQPSYSAALAPVPTVIECKATIVMGRAANP